MLKGARADLRKQKIAFFKTGGDSLTALLGGHVDVMASTPGNLVQALESKQIRVIAIGAAKRQSTLSFKSEREHVARNRSTRF